MDDDEVEDDEEEDEDDEEEVEKTSASELERALLKRRGFELPMINFDNLCVESLLLFALQLLCDCHPSNSINQ